MVHIQTINAQQVLPRIPAPDDEIPSVLLLPGLNNSGPRHWQSHWEKLPSFRRVEFGSWSSPKLRDWLPILDRTVRESPRRVVFAAHSLGCIALAWWAAIYWSEAFREKVVGALLVAPPDVDRFDALDEIRTFGPLPNVRLPFAATVVGSEDDPFASLGRSQQMATLWGSNFVNAGPLGHINAQSRIGEWTDGLRLLSEFTGGKANRLIAELGLRSAFG